MINAIAYIYEKLDILYVRVFLSKTYQDKFRMIFDVYNWRNIIKEIQQEEQNYTRL